MARRNPKKKSQTSKNNAPTLDDIQKQNDAEDVGPVNEINAILRRHFKTESLPKVKGSKLLEFYLQSFWMFIRDFPPGAVEVETVTANETHYLMKFECKLPL